MEQPPLEHQHAEERANGCALCNHPVVEHGYPTSLCITCRRDTIRFKVPFWIKCFAGGILLALVMSLFSLPQNLRLGIHMQKGKKAAARSEYFTAQKEFEQVLKQMPDYLEGQGNLLTASFYNEDFSTFVAAFEKVQNKNIEDQELYASIDYVIQKAGSYFASDSLTAIEKRFGAIDSVPDTELEKYINAFPLEVYPKEVMVVRFLDRKQYRRCDSMCNEVLAREYDYFPALQAKVTVKRLLDEADSSIYYCDMLLRYNKELVWAHAARARTLFYMHKDNEGFRLAEKAYAMDKSNGYAVASLVMGYHLQNQQEKRDALLLQAQRDSIDDSYFEYVRDVISGKEIFRK